MKDQLVAYRHVQLMCTHSENKRYVRIAFITRTVVLRLTLE